MRMVSRNGLPGNRLMKTFYHIVFSIYFGRNFTESFHSDQVIFYLFEISTRSHRGHVADFDSHKRDDILAWASMDLTFFS